MYRRPKFLETLLEIREQMAAEADYDVDLFAELVRQGSPGRATAELRSSSLIEKGKEREFPTRKTKRRIPVRK